MSLVIVDYGSGNLRSAAQALQRAAGERGLTVPIQISGEAEVVAAADRIVLPGVGAFGDCRAGLAALPGMLEALQEAVIQKARPFLGICVGMQLMAERGLEHGTHPGLGWIAGQVERLQPEDPALKIPHMGWNELQLTEAGEAHPVLAGLKSGTHFYFVHSYHFQPIEARQLLATVNYGMRIGAVVGRDNLIGTQFHPEKSQASGLHLLGNFLQWMA
ncbi:MAG TPA: imidazole glycerol phosphate synthase subunit HisH [Kiloniellales bacterium]|jgi:glutamine amidotransferase|nr:imidazole glycerol phosphate synthase subunit HisH [Kiloniellales bacterium]